MNDYEVIVIGGAPASTASLFWPKTCMSRS
jgi:hypothetical protein